MTGNMNAFLADLMLALAPLADQVPEDEDVVAGWGALVVFLLLIGAVVFLGFSLTKQLRKAQAAQDAGVYGSDEPADGDAPANKNETT